MNLSPETKMALSRLNAQRILMTADDVPEQVMLQELMALRIEAGFALLSDYEASKRDNDAERDERVQEAA